MSTIRLACETYTWQMPGEMYKGKLEQIMGVAQRAGFQGIEPETSFLVDLEDPERMKAALDQSQLELVALCHVEDWRGKRESEAEKANADKWINFLSHFPNTIYLPVQMPGKNRKDLRERQINLLSCVNALAERATDHGIRCSYHPNSPEGSIYRTREDYHRLLDGLKDKWIGYTPDIGHIAKGEMDPLEIIKEYRSLVNLVHYKDMFEDGRWAATGDGVIDMKGITRYLVDSDYRGWIVMEDECDRAITDPDGLTADDGVYIQKYLSPIL
ncbi:MAG: inosose dehydratase [Saprospiraceae bacterium]|jgi:inosose dehydratase